MVVKNIETVVESIDMGALKKLAARQLHRMVARDAKTYLEAINLAVIEKRDPHLEVRTYQSIRKELISYGMWPEILDSFYKDATKGQLNNGDLTQAQTHLK
jgi:hypothetical protein